MAKKNMIPKPGDTEKPSSAAAVMATLTVVVTPVPNLRMILPLLRLDMMVPKDTTA